MSDLSLEDIPLGGIKPTDHLFKGTNDGTCSRCREKLAEGEAPLLLWPEKSKGEDLYQFCNRCAWDPDSYRCHRCGCTDLQPCDQPCGWIAPNLCSNCVEDSDAQD